jgi:hypothetical protein
VVKSQNITLKISSDLVRKAKIVAAERGTSISALLTQRIRDVVGEEAEYETARRQAFKLLDQGWHLGRRPTKRENTRR